ncbi:MAG TPA: hypothetical protein VFQ52_10415 [Rhizomicrobium sp.]|nr:hypothetical protein [Rhizomicrobium sp.]
MSFKGLHTSIIFLGRTITQQRWSRSNNGGKEEDQLLARRSDYATTAGYVEVADQVMCDAADRATDRPAFGIVKGGKA